MQDTETFRAETRTWLEANCPPAMRQPLTQEQIVWSGSKVVFGNDDQRVWFERMRDRGWFAPDWPAELGGGGLSPKLARIVEQEMLRLTCRPPQFNLGVWMLGPVLLELGTEEQKREHLPPMMEGRMRWCQGFSEPNAGSDLASLKTSAIKDENGDFVVNGSKIWTSYGDQADWMYALVRTDTTVKKQEGISFILIDMKSPGVTVKPIELISGKSSFCEVFFDDVKVPARQLVGPLNGGWTVAKKLLQHVWRDRLAALLMDSQAFSLTHERVKEEGMARMDISGPASIMKLVQTEQEVNKYELLMQLMGQRGLSWEGDEFSRDEHDICRLWLLSKTYIISGGSSEVQLNIIAKRVLGLPG